MVPGTRPQDFGRLRWDFGRYRPSYSRSCRSRRGTRRDGWKWSLGLSSACGCLPASPPLNFVSEALTVSLPFPRGPRWHPSAGGVPPCSALCPPAPWFRRPLSGRPRLFPSRSFLGLARALPALPGPAPYSSPTTGRRFENGEYFLWKRREFADLKAQSCGLGFFPFIFLRKYLEMTSMPRSTKSTTSGEGITQSDQLYKPGLFHNLFTSAGPASLFFCLFRVGLLTPPLPFFSQ